MKNTLYAIGFVLVLAGGMMADSASLVPTITCVALGAIAVITAEGLFKWN